MNVLGKRSRALDEILRHCIPVVPGLGACDPILLNKAGNLLQVHLLGDIPGDRPLPLGGPHWSPGGCPQVMAPESDKRGPTLLNGPFFPLTFKIKFHFSGYKGFLYILENVGNTEKETWQHHPRSATLASLGLSSHVLPLPPILHLFARTIFMHFLPVLEQHLFFSVKLCPFPH
jgi:hypothetical protein